MCGRTACTVRRGGAGNGRWLRHVEVSTGGKPRDKRHCLRLVPRQPLTRPFRKADVAASLARRCRLVDAGPLVMSGSGACAELLFALSLGRASGPVHEGTSCFQGALPAETRPRWDKGVIAVARRSASRRKASFASLLSLDCRCCPVAGRRPRYAASRDAAWRSGS